MQDNNLELFPLVNLRGEVVGSATRGECHGGSMLLHPVVHLHIINDSGELYLQHRPAWKDIQPNRWDTAVGGHIEYGEEPLEALFREAREELGVVDFVPHHLCSYDFRSGVEHEYVYVYYTHYSGEITPTSELDGGAFWGYDKLMAAIGKGVLTPNFESEFKTKLQLLF